MLKDFNINMFSVYAPQIGSSEEEKEKLWTDLQEKWKNWKIMRDAL